MAGGLSPHASPLPCKSSGSVQLQAAQEHQPISLAGWKGWDAGLSLGCLGCVGEELHWPCREGNSQGPRPLSPIISAWKACGGPGILTTAEPYADTPLPRAGSGLRWPRAVNELTTPSL